MVVLGVERVEEAVVHQQRHRVHRPRAEERRAQATEEGAGALPRHTDEGRGTAQRGGREAGEGDLEMWGKEEVVSEAVLACSLYSRCATARIEVSLASAWMELP